MDIFLYFTIGGTLAGWAWEAYRAWKWRKLYLEQVVANKHLQSRYAQFDENETVIKWRGKILAYPNELAPEEAFDRVVWLADYDVESLS